MRTTPGYWNVFARDSPRGYRPRSKSFGVEYENTLWKITSAFGMTMVSPAAITRNGGAKLASFWWISSARLGRSNLSCESSPSRYTTSGPASSSETPATPSETRPRSSPAEAVAAARQSASASAGLEMDTDLRPEEVVVVRVFLDLVVGDAVDQADLLDRVLDLHQHVIADRHAERERVLVERAHVVADGASVAEVVEVAAAVAVGAHAAAAQRDVGASETRRELVQVVHELCEPVDHAAVVEGAVRRVDARVAVREPEPRAGELEDRVGADHGQVRELVRAGTDRLSALEALHRGAGAERPRDHLAEPERRERGRAVGAQHAGAQPAHRQVQPLRRVGGQLERELLRAVAGAVEPALAVGHREGVADLALHRGAPELHALVPEPRRRRGHRDERVVHDPAAEAQVVLAERDLEAAGLEVEQALVGDVAEVDVDVAEVVGRVAEPHQVPLEGEARVAERGGVADLHVAREVGVDEEARVPDVHRAVLEQPVALARE